MYHSEVVERLFSGDKHVIDVNTLFKETNRLAKDYLTNNIPCVQRGLAEHKMVKEQFVQYSITTSR